MANATLVSPEREAWSTKLKDVGFWAEWAALVGLVVLVVVFQALNPTFLSPGNIASMLVAAAILIILSVGQTFVIATAGIDLSVASTMTLGAAAFGQAYAAGWGLLVSCLLGVVAAALVGVVNGVIIARGRITDFIVTLGTLSAASGLALILADGKPVTIIDPALLSLSTGGIGIFGWSFLIAVAVAVIAHVVLFHTRFGTHVLATGGAPESATAMGISTQRVKIAVYTISGTLAGLSAILLIARIGAAEPASNTSFLLNSVAAVVLGGVSLFGGRGTIIGPFIGALLLVALVNGLTLLGVSQFYQPLAVGIVVVLAALLTRFQK
ncbi:ribose transport system permease protein [Streptosporangium becharense]|uniref:Ribose transport system permease protein n=1 Tax=Streptosporangium becharense TaxID=1816182 RepID=A0A7W9MHK9_9ACTN|nr:ABC transporter permease [Streptosporangium becharense]MBB2912494.1 ribose transport system permease protein [Streptosporangium becharense]MBB5820676.1 ribose transport system permease protein [Streptosporangium becharense]